MCLIWYGSATGNAHVASGTGVNTGASLGPDILFKTITIKILESCATPNWSNRSVGQKESRSQVADPQYQIRDPESHIPDPESQIPTPKS